MSIWISVTFFYNKNWVLGRSPTAIRGKNSVVELIQLLLLLFLCNTCSASAAETGGRAHLFAAVCINGCPLAQPTGWLHRGTWEHKCAWRILTWWLRWERPQAGCKGSLRLQCWELQSSLFLLTNQIWLNKSQGNIILTKNADSCDKYFAGTYWIQCYLL